MHRRLTPMSDFKRRRQPRPKEGKSETAGDCAKPDSSLKPQMPYSLGQTGSGYARLSNNVTPMSDFKRRRQPRPKEGKNPLPHLKRRRQPRPKEGKNNAAQAGKKAIPLCLPNNLRWNPETSETQDTREERRYLYIVDAAVAELRRIKDPVCVVAIAGPSRDGKSFILSEVFSQPDVFPVGFKMDAKTMGIWIWILPHKISDSKGHKFSVVLLDSEGIDATTAREQQDKQIFIMTVLLSSVLIYNSKGVPKRKDLNDLEFVTKLSREINATANYGSMSIRGEDAFHKTFPFFIWLLRDVLTDLPEDCKSIKDYFLKRVFQGPDPAGKNTTQEIADGILHYFSGFDAFCLPPLTTDKKVLKDVRRNRHLMNLEFFQEVTKFQKLLECNMGPKKSINEAEYVTGEALAILAKVYLQAINDPRSIPNLQSAWKTYVHEKCDEAKKNALVAYDKKMSADLSRLPCDEREILTSHQIAIHLGMDTFRQETMAISSEHTDMVLESFKNQANEHLCDWNTTNDRLTKESCEKILGRLKQRHLDPVLARIRGTEGAGTVTRDQYKPFFDYNSASSGVTYKGNVGARTVIKRSYSSVTHGVTYKEIDDACAQIESDYKSYVHGARSVILKVLQGFLKRLKDETEQHKEMLTKLNDYNDTLIKMRLERAKEEEEVEKLKRKNEFLKMEREVQEKRFDELEAKKIIELEIKAREHQNKENALAKKINDLEAAGMPQKITILRNELQASRKYKEKLHNQMSDLKREIANMKEQLRLANRPWYKKLFGIDK